ncbi:hypothetical protein A0J48_002945 [Sphaerospermopsis aphanizomenoides BCCUSP55]|uniref:hypothetical protein n=1 Tax=Sphaerospermopsis aphanizomenoides TaxID=459663 RepID=UPI00190382E9|nr:hypothetical protein [Sphaerospermopsis aphanizomenoides]MBK1986512.1 hypothetical protein [Sphaerospermopsis aphanizomenoides BCCUSP55]
MSLNELEYIEIVESDIIDDTVEVSSGCEWRGTGKEPQWDNPKSTKAYDHIIRDHGAKFKASNLQGRASSKNQDQGQWLNDQDWLKLEKLIPNYYGNYIIKFNRPIGRVYHTDGSVTDNVIYALIGRNPDGTIKYAYPIVKPK